MPSSLYLQSLTVIPRACNTACSLVPRMLSLAVSIPLLKAKSCLDIEAKDLAAIGASLFEGVACYLAAKRVLKLKPTFENCHLQEYVAQSTQFYTSICSHVESNQHLRELPLLKAKIIQRQDIELKKMKGDPLLLENLAQQIALGPQIAEAFWFKSPNREDSPTKSVTHAAKKPAAPALNPRKSLLLPLRNHIGQALRRVDLSMDRKQRKQAALSVDAGSCDSSATSKINEQTRRNIRISNCSEDRTGKSVDLVDIAQRRLGAGRLVIKHPTKQPLPILDLKSAQNKSWLLTSFEGYAPSSQPPTVKTTSLTAKNQSSIVTSRSNRSGERRLIRLKTQDSKDQPERPALYQLRQTNLNAQLKPEAARREDKENIPATHNLENHLPPRPPKKPLLALIHGRPPNMKRRNTDQSIVRVVGRSPQEAQLGLNLFVQAKKM